MKSIQKPKLLLATLCISFAMSANAGNIWSWFGSNAGDDGNPNTVGNAGAQSSKNNAPQATTNDIRLNVVNNTNTLLTSIIIKDASGKVLYSSNTGSSCIANDICVIKLKNNQVSNQATLFAYDKNNKLVTAYSFFNLISGQKIVDIQVDLSSLGVYVFRKITALQPQITYSRLLTEFSDAKYQQDSYSALGDYYLDFLGNLKDDKPVIAELVRQIDSPGQLIINPQSTKLKANKAPAAMATMPQVATSKVGSSGSSLFCTTAFKSSMDFVDKLKFLPIPGLSYITSGAKLISDVACGAKSTPDYSAQLTQMNAKLDAIATQVDSLGVNLDRFNDEWRQGEVNNFVTTFTRDRNTILTGVNYYFEALSLPGADGKYYPTLQALVNSYGGPQQALTKNKVLKAKIDGFVTNSPGMMTSFRNMMVSSGDAKKYLDTICKHSSSIPSDIISTRLWCNYRVLDVYVNGRSIADAVQGAYTDYKNAFANTDSVAAIATLSSTDIQAVDKSLAVFNPQTALYNPLEGLDPTLVSNINNISACKVKDPTTQNLETQIVEWYSTKGVGAGAPFIVTQCSDGNTLVKSRYYYNQTNNNVIDNDVVSVLGVLVPRRYFTGDYLDSKKFDWTSMSAQTNYPDSKYGERDSLTTSQSYTINGVVSSYNQNPLDPGKVQFTNGSISANATVQVVRRNDTNYERKLFVPTSSNGLTTSFMLADLFNNRGSNKDRYSDNFYSYLRVTDPVTQFSTVWAMRTDMYREWMDHILSQKYSTQIKFYFRTALQCMTNECSIDGNSLLFDKNASVNNSKRSIELKDKKQFILK